MLEKHREASCGQGDDGHAGVILKMVGNERETKRIHVKEAERGKQHASEDQHRRQRSTADAPAPSHSVTINNDAATGNKYCQAIRSLITKRG